MNKLELQNKIDKCFENAERMLNERGELIPMIDIEFEMADKKKAVIAIVLATGDDRNARNAFITGIGMGMGIIKRLGKINEVRCVALMSEAWFSTYDKNVDINNVPMPSKDPKRREMLIATGLTAKGLCVMKGKELFSVEVKGKRHFRLEDRPEMSGGTKHESAMLEHFFTGYKKAQETTEKNTMLDTMAVLFKDMTFDEMLPRILKVITENIKGYKSEFIKTNK